MRLDLNVIGRTSAGEDALEPLSEALGERLMEPVRNARQALGELQTRLRDRDVARSRKLRSEVQMCLEDGTPVCSGLLSGMGVPQ